MQENWNNKLCAAYASMPLEALAVFRVVFGLVHLADLVRRWPMIELLYSNQGVLSNHYLLFRPPSEHFFSLFVVASSPGEVRFLFLLLGAALLCFIAGYRTTFSHALCAIGFLSLHQRVPLIEYGGDVVSNIFWVLTFFLPLGARASLDAVRNQTPRDQSSNQNSSVCSLICTLCLFQFAAIYFLNAWSKSGVTWIDGSALYYTLHQDRLVTALGAWLVQNCPDSTLRWLTWGTRAVEFFIPLLLLSPFALTFSRRLALLLLWSLHSGIAFTMNLGVFSPVMMAAALLFLDARAARAAAAPFTRAFEALASLLTLAPREPRSEGNTFRRVAREVCALVLAYCFLSQLAVDNAALRQWQAMLPQPDWVRTLVGYGRLHQGWALFAPDAPRFDGRLVMDLELRSGKHFDPQTGREPEFGPVSRQVMPWSQAWDSYSLRLSFDRFAVYRFELERWILERGRGLHPFSAVDVVRYQVWWVWDETPAPGMQRQEPRRSLLIEGSRSISQNPP